MPGALSIAALALPALLVAADRGVAAQGPAVGSMPAAASGRVQPLAQAAEPPDRALETVIVTAADDGRLLNLRRGEQLRVVLGEIACTGYSWEIESIDRRLLRPEGRRTWQDPGPPAAAGFKGPSGLVGGPLQVSFLFRVMAAGEAQMVLRHWRPWEGPGSVDRRFRLRVRVGG